MQRAASPLRRSQAEAPEVATFRPLVEYQREPVRFVMEVLGDRPWGRGDPARGIPHIGQWAALLAAVDDPLLAVRSAKGVGKTRLLAWLCLWSFYCWADSMVITTATTWEQVRSQLWKEIHRAKRRARLPLPGKLLETRLELGPKWFMLGLSTKKPESMAGFHADTGLDATKVPLEILEQMTDDEFFGRTLPLLAPEVGGLEASRLASGAAADEPAAHRGQTGRMTVAIDEASGIDERLDDPLDGLATTPDSHIWRFGNPVRNQGRLYDIFHPQGEQPAEHVPGRDYWTQTIDARQAPAAIVAPARIARIAEAARKRGVSPEEDAQFQIEVMGVHATSSSDLVFPRTLLIFASKAKPKVGGLHLGCDIARQGDDMCTGVLSEDGTVCGMKTWGTGSGPVFDFGRSSDVIRAMMKAWGVPAHRVHIDVSGGWGWGVYDFLVRIHKVYVDPVNFGAGPQHDWDDVLGSGVLLRTRRQELHWVGMRALQEGLACIPNEPEFAPIWADLQAIRKKPLSAKAAKDAEFWEVEPKEAFKARQKRSPDHSEGWLCSLSRMGSVVPSFGAIG